MGKDGFGQAHTDEDDAADEKCDDDHLILAKGLEAEKWYLGIHQVATYERKTQHAPCHPVVRNEGYRQATQTAPKDGIRRRRQPDEGIPPPPLPPEFSQSQR